MTLEDEIRQLRETAHPLFAEAELLLEMAQDAQAGKPIDLDRLERFEEALRCQLVPKGQGTP